jgi:hypothetical protein
MGHVHLSSWLVCWMITSLVLMALSFVSIHGQLDSHGNKLNFYLNLFASVNMSLLLFLFCFVLFEKHTINADARIHAHTLISMNAHTHTLFLLAPPKDWAGGSDLQIDESTQTQRIFCICAQVFRHTFSSLTKQTRNKQIYEDYKLEGHEKSS